jgi:ribose transport system ATP-binding protein
VTAAALSLRGVTKTYPGVVALRDASFEVSPGEVHALVGENGAGKSTLMGIASGSTLPDSGRVEIAGVALDPPSPQLAEQLGLAIVYQHPALVPDLTVAENMAFAAPPRLRPRARERRAWARERLVSASADVEPDAYVRDLPVADRQLVEIARALSIEPIVLILDEPTEPLVAAEIERLLANVREISRRGAAVVYISHRIPEVKEVADRITVLRDGEVRGTYEAADVDEDEIVRLIAGRSFESTFPPKPGEPQEDFVLRVQGLSGAGFDEVDFQVRAGEIVGLAGVEGNGQESFIRALAGVTPATGEVQVAGADVHAGRVRDARAHGIVYVSSDRHGEGLFMPASVTDNVTATSLSRDSLSGIISDRRQRARASEQVARLSVRTASLEAPVRTLSGGNQQKVAIARSLIDEARVLLLDGPTQGVDVGSRVEMYRIAREAAQSGVAVVVLSSDGIELEGLCDRVAVFARGRIAGELSGAELTEEKLIGRALTAPAAADARAAAEPPRRWRLMPFVQSDFLPVMALLAAALGVVAFTALDNSTFMSALTFESIFSLLAVLVLLSLAQQVVVLSGGIDLSVGPAAGLLVVLASFFVTPEKLLWYQLLGVGLMLAAALAIGVANGLLTEAARMPAVIATLATYILLQGFSLLLRPTPDGVIDSAFTDVVATTIGVVPVALIVALAAAVALDVIVRRTRWGVALRAVGSDPTSAHRLGARVRLVRFSAYVVAGGFVFLGSLLLMGQAGVGSAEVGLGFTLSTITAVVLGGAAIGGGRGAFLGAVAGAALIQVVTSALPFLQLSEAWGDWLIGALILASALTYSSVKRVRVAA